MRTQNESERLETAIPEAICLGMTRPDAGSIGPERPWPCSIPVEYSVPWVPRELQLCQVMLGSRTWVPSSPVFGTDGSCGQLEFSQSSVEVDPGPEATVCMSVPAAILPAV